MEQEIIRTDQEITRKWSKLYSFEKLCNQI